jgi:hypothetical protein
MASKRPLADSSLSQPSKRSKNSTLNNYFDVPPLAAPDGPFVASELIEDRESVFIAHAASVTTPQEYQKLHKYIREVVNGDAPASHVMIAARYNLRSKIIHPAPLLMAEIQVSGTETRKERSGFGGRL